MTAPGATGPPQGASRHGPTRYADAPQFSAPVADAHRAALRSLSRVVEDTAPRQSPDLAAEGICSMLEAGGVLCVTGAGVSTASGIPDYRGPQGSLHRHRPMTYQEFQHDAAARRRYWARSFLGWRHMRSLVPNGAHHLLAQWQRRGLLGSLITQNVDGLHAAAGSDPLIPIHGDLDRIICLDCGGLEDRTGMDQRLEEANPGYVESAAAAAENVNPDGDVELDDTWVAQFHMVACLLCGSDRMKPDVVYFGEEVPAARKAAVAEAVERAPALLIVGSSMAVMSGFRIALEMARAQKPIGIINGGPSRADTKAQWRWRTEITEALESLEGRDSLEGRRTGD